MHKKHYMRAAFAGFCALCLFGTAFGAQDSANQTSLPSYYFSDCLMSGATRQIYRDWSNVEKIKADPSSKDWKSMREVKLRAYLSFIKQTKAKLWPNFDWKYRSCDSVPIPGSNYFLRTDNPGGVEGPELSKRYKEAIENNRSRNRLVTLQHNLRHALMNAESTTGYFLQSCYDQQELGAIKELVIKEVGTQSCDRMFSDEGCDDLLKAVAIY